jgi:mannose-6-phosphate isomerase-like protein (cupin superfamily)
VRYCIEAGRASVEDAGEEGERPLFDPGSGCAEFTQRELSFDTASEERRDDVSDEVVYVLEGEGDVVVGGEPYPVRPGAALFAPAGTAWRVDAVRAAPLRVLSVLVHDPLPPSDGRTAYVDTADESTLGATAGREFRLAFTPERGCATVTQFVGHIPPGRAPDHFHRYDEVVYVLRGSGALHIGGETAPLAPGAAIHLPARLVHALENEGDDEMLVLGVFRPAGSPAEAYYPDGTPAVVPSEAA